MKKVLSVILVFVMLLSCSVTAFAGASASGESGPYDPVTLDEIQKGTILAFDFEEGAFDETTYYAKILGGDGEEYIYALASSVYVGDLRYNAEEVAGMVSGEITFVLRGGKIKYINPCLPDGLFESVEVTACYRDGEAIYANLEFENIVDEFKLIMAAYNDDNILCSVQSFDISHMDSYYELEMPANGGDRVKLFFWESVSGLEPLCEIRVGYIPTEYGYLVGVDKTDGEYTFEIFTTEGELETFTCAEEIAVDEEFFVDGDERVADRLEFAAESANEAYEDETNAVFHQPLMYAVDENGEIAHIDTVVSSVNKGISKLVKDNDGDFYYRSYKEQLYKVSSNSFEDFKVKSDTKVIFVPDDRSNTNAYVVYESYKDVFETNKTYHVEAYGLSPAFMASLVLVYKNEGEHVYASSSPAMIVESKVQASDGVYIKGYALSSYSLMQVEVDTDEVQDLSRIGKGDVIRYIKNDSSEMIDYQIWYDRDNAVQDKSCDDISAAITNRILEVNAISTTPVVNYPNASFRLQYGTVCDISLSNEGDTICVTPTIANDSIDMAVEGNGVVEWEIESSVKIFEYDNGNVITDADLKDIIPGKTEIIAYSSQGELRMLYIVKKPYVSEKKIMIVQKGVDTVDGCEITGYSEGEEVFYTVDAAKEPIIEEVFAGKIIAYVPDGDSIKDIEIVYSVPDEPFDGADGEGYIAPDTKESVVFGLAEYSANKFTINGVDYTTTDDTNYLLMEYVSTGANWLSTGAGTQREMRGSYVLIRVKEDKPSVICDAVIFQDFN